MIPGTPAIIGDNLNIYEGRKLSAFDMDKLIYFGMSVFWRGACREWKSTKGSIAPSVDLGEHYEPIRKFLLGGSYPQNVHIVVLIHSLKPVPNAALAVELGESGYGKFYWFYVNGLGFMLYLGDQLPHVAESECAQHGVNGPVVVDRAFSNMVYAFLKGLLEGNKKSEGVIGLLKTCQISSSDIGKHSKEC